MRKHTPNRAICLLFFLLAALTDTFAQVDITQAPAYESLEKWIDYTKTLERRPYRNGATGPYAFDCSGFTQYCYKQLGIELSRTSALQAKDGKKIRKRKRLKTGDLVCFNGSKIGRTVGHVGIVVENNNGVFTFIHASSSVGVTISRSDTKYYDDRYVTGRRITDNKKLRRALKKFGQEVASEQATSKASNKPVDDGKELKERHSRHKREEGGQQPVETGKTQKNKSEKTGDKSTETDKARNTRQDNTPADDSRTSKRNAKETVENAFKNNTVKNDTAKVKPAENADSTITKKDSSNTKPTQADGANTISGNIHKVQKGDTLYNIAKRAGCTVQQIKEWNNLTSDALSIGQELRVK
ncbi:MAG: C40 family peptidase [Paludibacteraceae bacterium]|nr:C40 family peptidase [Paludibacteraceae bacterium]